MRELLLKHYGQGHLTLQQYRTLLGLVENGNEDGAYKGLSKIMGRRRNKRINKWQMGAKTSESFKA